MIDITPLTPSEFSSKAVSVDELRSRLRPFDAIDLLNEVSVTLADEGRTITTNHLRACDLQAKIAMFRISKSMPDFKAIDHSFSESNSKVVFNISMEHEPKKQSIVVPPDTYDYDEDEAA